MNFLNRSEYFETALSKDWLAGERNIELKDCSVEALHAAVNFMYGINIPEDFKEHADLLHLAEFFMMDNLKEVVEELLTKSLSKKNYLAVSHLAELYSITSLITKCGDFVFEEIGEVVSWQEMGKFPQVMIAFGKRAMKERKGKVVKKKMEDFASKEEYGEYVMDNVDEGTVVRLRVNDYMRGKKVGDLLSVDTKFPRSGKLRVLIESGAGVGLKVNMWSHAVEMLAQ